MRHRPPANKAIRLGAALLLWLVVGLDGLGLALHFEALWRGAGRLAWLALTVAVIGGLLQRKVGGGGLRALSLLLGMLLFALARWLRGSAGVPPDPPLLAAAVIGAALYTLALVIPRRR